MSKAKLLLDTNILVDYLNMREPFYADARKLMVIGYLGEFELWISSSQVTDLVYILSDGGKSALVPKVRERLRKVRSFVNVYPVGEDVIDRALAGAWADFEDELLFTIALELRADALITRNACDFETDLIKVMDCAEFFNWVEQSMGLDYIEMGI